MARGSLLRPRRSASSFSTRCRSTMATDWESRRTTAGSDTAGTSSRAFLSARSAVGGPDHGGPLQLRREHQRPVKLVQEITRTISPSNMWPDLPTPEQEEDAEDIQPAAASAGARPLPRARSCIDQQLSRAAPCGTSSRPQHCRDPRYAAIAARTTWWTDSPSRALRSVSAVQVASGSFRCRVFMTA